MLRTVPQSSPQDRAAALRGRMSAATPRITRREVAEVLGYSEQYVKIVLSDPHRRYVETAIGRIEQAMDVLESKRARTGRKVAA